MRGSVSGIFVSSIFESGTHVDVYFFGFLRKTLIYFLGFLLKMMIYFFG